MIRNRDLEESLVAALKLLMLPIAYRPNGHP